MHARGVVNRSGEAGLEHSFRDEQRHVLERIGDRPLAEIPSVAAWRRAFSGFGVEPTRYRSAVEALLRRLTKQGEIPSLNTLVDLANLVSIRYGLPVAVFDQRSVSGSTTVRFAEGGEAFTDLGGDGSVNHPEPGEVIFVDDVGLVSARRWCWRQSAESASRPDTTEILVTVEGHHDDAAADVFAAVTDLRALLELHAGDPKIETAVLTLEQPVFQGIAG
ncbi:MAG: phenylalanine--tRNA ligase beta subunit-related protein [Actinomycetota bacterium]|nr:phenylalanine--tRNA ligase beta subunit-related protein [Actinomycetota bacterium]